MGRVIRNGMAFCKLCHWAFDEGMMGVSNNYNRIKGNRRTLHFICVDGDMDIRKAQSDYKFSWDGNDENDPVGGFGEFTCDGDILIGRIYIHDGDDSSFVAKKISLNGLSLP